ncbi:MAG: 30S ribosome-binding factor RbfA [Actinomycetota bacterium]
MSQRTDKVQRLAREVLGETIQNLKDPRLGFTTVTAVRITPDLRQARVFVSVLGSDEERESTMDALASATPVLRGELGRQVRMKYTPELLFHLDTSADEAQRLEEILHRIESESPPSAGEEDAGEGDR